ncbi:hypothetical protein BN14_08651 [Rhizoctonia solani AG-1 IB]|uniref:5'-Nucleotidase C-terminal domain-containing protein n=1 Tax=Thanatephorus cucumeris (strain AG1-IB / isolate 7/3/14) TaxID=1108050 RepID=M5C5F1_THACB|nr:hypothetical protein BN14_08651 [Rhizoctonia solani AG-1 IB]
METVQLPIIHFNDVYNMTYVPDNADDKDMVMTKTGDLTHTNIDKVVQFSQKIDEIRAGWIDTASKADLGHTNKSKGNSQHGLVLFSGDLFSPSVESMLTRGLNMVRMLAFQETTNLSLGFDQLVEFSNFSWILSNVRDNPKPEKSLSPSDLGDNPQPKESLPTPDPMSLPVLPGLHEYRVFKRNGIRIGVIGLMSRDAFKSSLSTVTKNLEHIPTMEKVCIDLSEKLRKPEEQGGFNCDIVLALTHATHKEVKLHIKAAKLARLVNAYPSTKKVDLENLNGIDAIFGGHEHTYFLGQGVELEAGDYKAPDQKGEKLNDDGCLIVKSGYDFDDFSQVTLELERKNERHRRYVVKSAKVTRHHITPTRMSSKDIKLSAMGKVLQHQFEHEILTGLEVPIARLTDTFDGKFNVKDPRKGESAVGNWLAETLITAYNDMGFDPTVPRFVPEIFITTGGAIRSKELPRVLKIRDIIGLLPFRGPLVAMKLSPEEIRSGLEGALSKATNKESKMEEEGTGRFPVFAGMRVQWNSGKPPGSRVETVKVRKVSDSGKVEWIDIEERDSYDVLVNRYLAEGNSGFDSFGKVFNGDKSKCSECDIPPYQVLKSYLGTKHALRQIKEKLIEAFVQGDLPDLWETTTGVGSLLGNLYDLVVSGKTVSRIGEASKLDAEVGKKVQANGAEKGMKLIGSVEDSAENLLKTTKGLDMPDTQKAIKKLAAVVYNQTPDAYIPTVTIGIEDGRIEDIYKPTQ